MERPDESPPPDSPDRSARPWPSLAAFAVIIALVLGAFWFIGNLFTETFGERAIEYTAWMIGGLMLGLAIMASRRDGVSLPDASIQPIIERLTAYRREFLVAYAVLLLAWALTTAALRVDFWPMLFEALFSYYTPGGSSDIAASVWAIVIFVALQAVFLSGLGFVRIRRGPTRPWQLFASIAVFAMLIGIIGWGLMTACLQLTDRVGDVTNERWRFRLFGTGGLGLPLLGASWMLWVGVGWILSRGVSHETALARMVGLIFAGSWVEFAVALPVELVTRDRTRDCPCQSGSWVALLCTGPLLLWAIGPGIVLLYWREWRLTRTDPVHARRVLQRKTRRVRTAS